MAIERRRGSEGRAEDPLWIVVLAGGQGRRLEHFVRRVLGDTRPKQFCRIIGRRSMLRHTWDRARRLVPARRVVTVITNGQARFLAAAAGPRAIPGRVLVQPADCGTGVALCWPLLWIAHRQPDATVVVFPADHFVWEEYRFLRHVAEAVNIARRQPDRLVLLGMEPDNPETSYGWIKPGPPCPEVLPGRECFTVQNFWEKPDRALARRLLADGGLWNSGVMAGTVSAYLQAVRRLHPETLDVLQAAASRCGTSAKQAAMAAAYQRVPRVDFSRDILAWGPDTLGVLPVRHLTWSDWGEPARILDTVKRIGSQPAGLFARAVPSAGASPGPGTRERATRGRREVRRVGH